ncbi:SOS response-associated peptidase [Propionivibrio sp.]|uniref:SOS response-associated peptidase n=1 Tax=Propionivibrio sp. TaxID=2212460 RepID=UPI003BEFB383
MCGRFALKETRAELIAHFGLDECAGFSARYNIPPGADIPVIRQSPEGKRVLRLLRWGLVPRWAVDPAIGARLSNARGETVAEKFAFRSSFQSRRCLIPASGFFEWQALDRIKQPFFISLKSGEPLAMAGLWESWRAPDGSILRTTCVVTTSANDLIAPIHDRMPVIVAPEHWCDWLEGTVEKASGLVAPFSASEMQAWPVHRRVGWSGEKEKELIEPFGSNQSCPAIPLI